MRFIKGQKKTSGRKKGVPNKATADIKAALREHGPAMVTALLKLTKDDDPRVRLGAIQTAMDRGYGKAVQHIEAEISVYDSLSFDDRLALLEVLDALDGSEEGDTGGSAPTQH